MNTKNILLGAAVLGVVSFAGSASAQDVATGTLGVTGTIVSSISLTIDSAGGGSQSGMGTTAATTALGSISKFGALPTNFTRAVTSTDWTLSSTVGVTVTKANSISTAYTLNAKLSTAPTAGVVWKVNAITLNATTAQPLTAAGVWGSTPTYAWDLVIADSVATATPLANTIMFDAISG
jgi:hypothetical protein